MGAWLLMPIIVIRFGLLGMLNFSAIKCAAHSTSLTKTEWASGAIYKSRRKLHDDKEGRQ